MRLGEALPGVIFMVACILRPGAGAILFGGSCSNIWSVQVLSGRYPSWWFLSWSDLDAGPYCGVGW
jgi:hypothetical protein